MYEYEYSKEVNDLKEYIDYCENNGFILESKVRQKRIIYRNNGIMARITVNDIDGKVIKELDFKEDKIRENELVVRKESLPITFTDDKIVFSILDILGYVEDNTLIRTRYNYVKDDVKFELDEYESPTKKYVAAIEGNNQKVDAIWNEINK